MTFYKIHPDTPKSEFLSDDEFKVLLDYRFSSLEPNGGNF